MKQQRLHSNTTPTILVSATENSPASLNTELKGTGDQRMFYFLVFFPMERNSLELSVNSIL